LAVADAATATQSPVILGFSGAYLTHPRLVVEAPISIYAAMGLEVCRRLPVPACLLFNESPHLGSVLDCVDQGFNLVMFDDENMAIPDLKAHVKKVCEKAHSAGVAVEAGSATLPEMENHSTEIPADLRLTDPGQARLFLEETGVDALAVNLGQAHYHGRKKVRLDLDLLTRLKEAVDVPLVLHGASSVQRNHLEEAIRRGIRKINVGSILKQVYFQELQTACRNSQPDANPYEVIGSGTTDDVLSAGRVAMRKVVEDHMRLFGSADRAKECVP
jgi:fructose/tagatose bisphosphate aldolase